MYCNKSLASQSFIFSCFIFSLLFLFHTDEIAAQCPQGCDDPSNNTFLGVDAGISMTTGGDNTLVGEATGKSITDGLGNSFFGVAAGLFNETGSENSFFGRDAGRNSLEGNNSYFGYNAGKGNEDTGGVNNFGYSNSFFGHSAGRDNNNGYGNSFFGSDVGRVNTEGAENSAFGLSAAERITTGYRNSIYGTQAGSRITTGSYNICIGSTAGPKTGSGDVDSTLYIDIKESNDPLIYGHFQQDLVRINGSLEVMGSLNPASSRTLKAEFKEINHDQILRAMLDLPIESWVYTSALKQRHIGPTAEDFKEAFEIGDGRTISTVDADGIVMASLQALAQKVEQLEVENEELRRDKADLFEALDDIQRRLSEIEKSE